MRPYPVKGKRKIPFKEAVFNYRLSRGRRTVENAFGIMASNWWIFRKPIIAEENTVIAITIAAVALHNFVKMSEQNAGVRYYSGPIDTEIVESEQWRTKEMGAFAPVSKLGSNTYSIYAKAIRNKLCDYFVEKGAIECQYERLYN